MSNIPRSTAELRLSDIDLLRVDAKQALARERPGTDAIWSALLQPKRAILRRYREALALVEDQDPFMADQLRDADGRQLVGPLGRLMQHETPTCRRCSALGEALVAKALLGRDKSIDLSIERTEGRPGT
jgi:hypothetical protein